MNPKLIGGSTNGRLFVRSFAMQTTTLSTVFGMLVMCLAALTGCGKSNIGSPPTDASTDAHSHSHAHGHSHDHDHGHGPHGGHIIELGSEDYHAELTQDPASQMVGIYLLGGDLLTAAPVDSPSLTMYVSSAGETTEYTLPAVAQPDEPAGKSSYFELASEPLLTALSGQPPNSQARLSITIGGMPYAGAIEAADEGHSHVALQGHSHAHDDALVWRKETSEQGYDFALGHHGTSLLAGSEVEPAVQITRDGQPVAEAQVFNALLADDGETVLAEEVATVYEPPTSEEPAHYAQGALKIPPGTRQATIRYRIVLPEGKGERTFDVPVDVK
jgi:hypothetical protein